MSGVSYYETILYKAIERAIQARRQELLEELAVGVSFEEYLRKIGHLNGISDSLDIMESVSEKIRSST
jgi:hypothetical protein